MRRVSMFTIFAGKNGESVCIRGQFWEKCTQSWFYSQKNGVVCKELLDVVLESSDTGPPKAFVVSFSYACL